jgi:hypothetical protein
MLGARPDSKVKTEWYISNHTGGVPNQETQCPAGTLDGGGAGNIAVREIETRTRAILPRSPRTATHRYYLEW